MSPSATPRPVEDEPLLLLFAAGFAVTAFAIAAAAGLAWLLWGRQQ